MPWTITRPTVDDVEEMGRVRVRVWQEAYEGLMPADYLAALGPTDALPRWREWIATPSEVTWWIARDADGIVGLTSSGPPRDDHPPAPLELYAINVLSRAHGTGLADELMAHSIGDRPAYLWVLDGNDRAVAFYRRHGFTDDGGRKPDPDTGMVEMRMARGHDTR